MHLDFVRVNTKMAWASWGELRWWHVSQPESTPRYQGLEDMTLNTNAGSLG